MASKNNVVSMPPPSEEKEAISLTVAQHRFGIKRQTIERLISDNHINPKKRGGRYETDSLVWELLRHYKHKSSEHRQANDLETAKIRKENAHAEKLELDNSFRKGELIPAEEHQKVVNEIAIAVLDTFNKIEAEVPGLLAESPDQESEFYPLVKRWVSKARTRLASEFEE